MARAVAESSPPDRRTMASVCGCAGIGRQHTRQRPDRRCIACVGPRRRPRRALFQTSNAGTEDSRLFRLAAADRRAGMCSAQIRFAGNEQSAIDNSLTQTKGLTMKTSPWLDGLFQYAGILGLSAVLGAGCNVHDNPINIPNAQINATTDVSASNVMPAATVPIAVTVQNVFLIDQSATPPPEHAKDAGHLVVYLDDVDSMPLLTTAQTNFSVTIPAET